MEESEKVSRTEGTSFVTATEIARELGCDRRRVRALLLDIEYRIDPCPFPIVFVKTRRLYKKDETVRYLSP